MLLGYKSNDPEKHPKVIQFNSAVISPLNSEFEVEQVVKTTTEKLFSKKLNYIHDEDSTNLVSLKELIRSVFRNLPINDKSEKCMVSISSDVTSMIKHRQETAFTQPGQRSRVLNFDWHVVGALRTIEGELNCPHGYVFESGKFKQLMVCGNQRCVDSIVWLIMNCKRLRGFLMRAFKPKPHFDKHRMIWPIGCADWQYQTSFFEYFDIKKPFSSSTVVISSDSEDKDSDVILPSSSDNFSTESESSEDEPELEVVTNQSSLTCRKSIPPPPPTIHEQKSESAVQSTEKEESESAAPSMEKEESESAVPSMEKEELPLDEEASCELKEARPNKRKREAEYCEGAFLHVHFEDDLTLKSASGETVKVRPRSVRIETDTTTVVAHLPSLTIFTTKRGHKSIVCVRYSLPMSPNCFIKCIVGIFDSLAEASVFQRRLCKAIYH